MSDEERGSAKTKLVRCDRCGCGSTAGGVAAEAVLPDGYHADWGTLAAEMVGSGLLVALSCLLAAVAASPLARALGAGLIVCMLVQSFDHVSGALLNPAVTLAAGVRGRVSWRCAALSAAGQLAAAAAAPALPRLLLAAPSAAAAAALPAPRLPPPQAAALEALATGCLVLASCAAWDARNRLLPESWPLRVGLVVAALTLLTDDLTGASLNPARSFGPALWAADFTHHWVYWVGPLGGSLVSSLLYTALWRAPPNAAPRGAAPLSGGR